MDGVGLHGIRAINKDTIHQARPLQFQHQLILQLHTVHMVHMVGIIILI